MTEGALARRDWAGDTRTGDRARLPQRDPAGSRRQRPLLLIADDEPPVLHMLQRLGERLGYDTVTCEGGQAALHAVRDRTPDLALVDLRMPDVNGMDVLRQLRADLPGCPVVIMTAYGAIDSAVEAIRLGAREYITKPFDFARLRQLLAEVRDEAARPAPRPSASAGPFPDLCALLGETAVMREVSAVVRTLAQTAQVVLVSGEPGCGQDLVARAFHQCSARRDQPFVSINCSRLVDALFERELFGHEKGAFSGADQAKPGLFEAARGGTMLLDDVGDLPLAVQGMLLHALETGEVQRVGAQRTRPVDVAVVAVTQRDLRADVAAGRFRADLYYRLSRVGIVLPPLRERRDDIPVLAVALLRECAPSLGKVLTGFAADAVHLLQSLPWEANVRGLRACVERACEGADGPLVTAEDIQLALQAARDAPPSRTAGLHVVRSGQGRAPLNDVEREHIVSVLREVRGNRVAAARVLGISRRALYRRLARHQIVSDALRAVPPRDPNE
ncbi:MAG: sigma-54-dependent transcriptional regulator [Vicinamibacterales bacterium]